MNLSCKRKFYPSYNVPLAPEKSTCHNLRSFVGKIALIYVFFWIVSCSFWSLLVILLFILFQLLYIYLYNFCIICLYKNIHIDMIKIFQSSWTPIESSLHDKQIVKPLIIFKYILQSLGWYHKSLLPFWSFILLKLMQIPLFFISQYIRL